jgi:hypothetical protein
MIDAKMLNALPSAVIDVQCDVGCRVIEMLYLNGKRIIIMLL